MKMRRWIPAVMLVFLGVSTVEAVPEGLDKGAISASLSISEPTVMLGVPVYMVFKVKNNLAQDLEMPTGVPLEWLFQTDTVHAVDEAGQPVRGPKLQLNQNGMGGWMPLRAGEEKEFTICGQNFARITKPGVYQFIAKPEMPIRNAGEHGKGTVVPLEASATLTVLPLDRKKLGALIDDLGRKMMGTPQHDEAAGAKLAGIDDPRVVPWFVQALKSGDYDLEFAATDVLGCYNSDEAVAALERALSDKDSNIVAGACNGLQNSPNPKADAVLLRHRKDASDEIRNHALNTTWRMSKEEAVSLLKDMTRDQSPIVRQNAADLLKIRAAEPAEEHFTKNATADTHWSYIETIEKWVRTAGMSPLGFDRLSKAAAAFERRYPNDGRRWKVKLEVVEMEAMMDNVTKMVTMGTSYGRFENVESDLKVIAAAPDADKGTVAEAQQDLSSLH